MSEFYGYRNGTQKSAWIADYRDVRGTSTDANVQNRCPDRDPNSDVFGVMKSTDERGIHTLNGSEHILVRFMTPKHLCRMSGYSCPNHFPLKNLGY